VMNAPPGPRQRSKRRKDNTPLKGGAEGSSEILSSDPEEEFSDDENIMEMSATEIIDVIHGKVIGRGTGVPQKLGKDIAVLLDHLREKISGLHESAALGEQVKILNENVVKLNESVGGVDRDSYANVALRAGANLNVQPGAVANGTRQPQAKVDPPKMKFIRLYRSNETAEARVNSKGEKYTDHDFQNITGELFDILFNASDNTENPEVRDFKFVNLAGMGIGMNVREEDYAFVCHVFQSDTETKKSMFKIIYPDMKVHKPRVFIPWVGQDLKQTSDNVSASESKQDQ